MPKYNPNSIWTGKKEDPAYRSKRVQPSTPAKSTPSESAKTAEPAAAAEAQKPATATGTNENSYFKKTPLAHFDERPARQSRAVYWWVGVFVVLLVGGLFYLFFLRPPAGPNVGIQISKPDQALTGDQFTFSISPANYSQNILRNATLSVFLPDTISFVGQPTGQRVVEQVLGDLGPGSINKEDFNLIVTGGPNTVQHVTVKLLYSTDPSGKTQFETDSAADIVVGGAAVSLVINTPSSIVSGQDFQTNVTYTNNTGRNVPNVELTMQYPPVFTFTRSSIQPDSAGNNSWNLGTIPPGGTASFIITGNIVGPNNAIYTLDGTLVGNISGVVYALTDQTASMTVGNSPLSVSVSVNNTGNYVAQAGDNLSYTLNYTNSSNVTFQNVTLKAAFVGSMFDFTTLSTNGSFSSLNNTVTWSAANTPELLNVGPGQSGSVTVNIKTKTNFPIRLVSNKNFTLKVTAQIASPTIIPGAVASSTASATTLENKVGGKVVLSDKGLWRDASSGILNSGPYPPKVNKATQYTIHWILTNYATDLNGVTVSAYLQSGTTCTGKIKSNISSAPTCNPANGLVTWSIPSLPATTGIVNAPAEAVIQVQNTPAVNQVGTAVTLIGQATLQATDAFTGVSLQSTAPSITTDLPDDKTVANISNHSVTQ